MVKRTIECILNVFYRPFCVKCIHFNKTKNVTDKKYQKKSANSIETSSTSKGNTTGSGTSASGKTSENGGVKTGDTANVLGLLGAAVASLGAAGTSLRFRRKNKKK